MAKPSFIERVSPSKARSKLIDWPLDPNGQERVRLSVLGSDALEQANLAADEHFRAMFADAKGKPTLKIAQDSIVFLKREQLELVWRAYATEDGNAIAANADELAKQPDEVLSVLYAEFSRFQAEVTTRPMTQRENDAFIEALKKNTQGDLLSVLPSSWLRQLIITLASPPADSTTAKEPG